MLLAQESSHGASLVDGDDVLRIIAVNDHLVFYENDNEMFQIPLANMEFFLQTAKDLENFESRLSALVYTAKIASSILLSILTGGLGSGVWAYVIPLTAGSAPFFMPEAPKDEHLDSLDERHLNYLLSPHIYEPELVPIFNLEGLVSTFTRIYHHYRQRIYYLDKRAQKFDHPDELVCDINQSGVLKWSHSAGDQFHLKVSKMPSSENHSGLWYSMRLISGGVEGASHRHWWVPVENDRSVVRVRFNKRYFGVMEMEFIKKMTLKPQWEHVNLAQILASLGVRTRIVSFGDIVDRRPLNVAFDWATALRACLVRGE